MKIKCFALALGVLFTLGLSQPVFAASLSSNHLTQARSLSKAQVKPLTSCPDEQVETYVHNFTVGTKVFTYDAILWEQQFFNGEFGCNFDDHFYATAGVNSLDGTGRGNGTNVTASLWVNGSQIDHASTLFTNTETGVTAGPTSVHIETNGTCVNAEVIYAGLGGHTPNDCNT